MKKSDLELYDYHSVDFDTCLNIFHSNSPTYFAPEELPDFEAFLLDLPGPYLMLKYKGEVAACGGFAFNQQNKSADLCWGMVHRHYHKQGLGDALLQERLNRIKLNPDITFVRLNTCQLTDGFFNRVGFATETVIPNGFAPGLDKHDMTLRLR